MKREITIQEVMTACNIIRRYKIKLHTFFMVGFPFETEESLNDTVKALEQIKSDIISYSIFTPT